MWWWRREEVEVDEEEDEEEAGQQKNKQTKQKKTMKRKGGKKCTKNVQSTKINIYAQRTSQDVSSSVHPRTGDERHGTPLPA